MEKELFKSWWKYLACALLAYTVAAGLIFEVPRLAILNETIRALHFHVPMWFGMILLLLVSMIYAVKTLSSPALRLDDISESFAKAGVFMGVLGILTGSFWANFTWGAFWTNDPKLNAAAIGLLIYLAYFILRGSIESEEQRARISAIYNIFSFPVLVTLLFVLPRLTDSLHPGNGGNPGFNSYDLDSNLRLVFYPAVLGWTLLGGWVASLLYRVKSINRQLDI